MLSFSLEDIYDILRDAYPIELTIDEIVNILHWAGSTDATYHNVYWKIDQEDKNTHIFRHTNKSPHRYYYNPLDWHIESGF